MQKSIFAQSVITNIADLYYVFTKFINDYQNITHAESFCSLMSKLCDHPLSFFLQKWQTEQTSWDGFMIKMFLPHSNFYTFAIYTLTSFQQMK